MFDARQFLAGIHVREKPPYLTDQQWHRLNTYLSGESFADIAQREGVTNAAVRQSVMYGAIKVARRRRFLKHRCREARKAATKYAEFNLPYILGSLQNAMRGQDKSLMR